LQTRVDTETTKIAGAAEEQFALGVRDLEAGLYDIARQRFEYVIRLDPNYPGVTERLAEVLLAINITATATPVPTPTLTPTPDLRGAEDLYFQAERLMAEEDWTAALETLDSLRKNHPGFRAVDVDGMYFVVLRNRGVNKIRLDGNLEGGMYDLARAELFGPLDRDAEAWRSWARLYVLGASYWDVNWARAISVFSELALIAPNLRDTANWTATERLRIALIRYGDQFAFAEEWCTAQEQYEAALAIAPDPVLEPTAKAVEEECSSPEPEDEPEDATNTPEPPAEPTNTPEPPAEPTSTSTPNP
jgi:tetratricopeptide (TPR) repeat protein